VAQVEKHIRLTISPRSIRNAYFIQQDLVRSTDLKGKLELIVFKIYFENEL
jgi:hypothetical protein